MANSIEESAAELKRVYAILSADLEESRRYGQSNPTAFAHRTLIRTFFALVEGLSYQLRRYALTYADHDASLLSPQEIDKLKEVKSFLPTLQGVIFSIRCFAKVHHAQFEPDCDCAGWQAMQTTVEIRNALTHPKSIAGLEVQESQIEIEEQAAVWWKNTVTQMLESCREATEN